MKLKYASLVMPALALATALGLGACGKVQQVTSSATGSGRDGAGTQVVAGCPTLIGNDLNTAYDFNLEFGAVVQFRSDRIRIETQGDATEVPINEIGACAATDVPSINFVRGHANVFLSGTNTSVTTSGLPLTFGPLLFPGTGIEDGVVVAQDAQGNVLEIIWPALAGDAAASPIMRVELAAWNFALVNAGSSLDVVWDVTASQDGVETTYKGSCQGMSMDGTPVLGGGGAAITPCPATLAGTGGTVVNVAADVVQFRSNRLRIEVVGDVASGTIGATGACAASDAPSVFYTGGTANIFRAGTTTSAASGGRQMTFGPLLFPGLLVEPGVVVADDANRNVLEIIWPGLAGLPPGPPILRLQLRRFDSWVRTGRSIDVVMRFDARDAAGATASYDVRANGLVLPAQR